jgi:diguanylate cyclase (GGDEF)-like protein/PAS domain S-box-containing protein
MSHKLSGDTSFAAAGPERETHVFREPAVRFLEGLALPAWIVGPDGTLEYVNAAWCDIAGRSGAEQLERGLLTDILADDRAPFERLLHKALDGRSSFQSEFQFRRADGQHRLLSCSASTLFDSTGVSGGLIGVCVDLTERRQREEQLAFMATHDSLTGLPNRRLFDDTLGRATARARRGNHSTLMLLDIDNLKSYNDARGHLQGDQALVNFALLLQRHVRAGDLLARIGGDEFAVLFEGTGVAEAREVAERMRVAVGGEDFVSDSRRYELGLSAGLVLVDGTLDPHDVLDLADAAMYEAKAAGRNRIMVTQPGEVPTAPKERISSRVREALADERFTLHFQPVVNLNDGSVVYYETLVRMVDTDGEVLSPSEFLTSMERLGLMPRLTRMIVTLALHALTDNPTASVSLNIAAGDLADDSLPRFVHEELRRQGVDPARLLFEMPETAVMGNLAATRNWMDRLGPLGCRFVLDEFGVGFGMFGLLRELDFEQVKLDGSIVTALSANGDNRQFVESVRRLIESQGRIAVAIWVESAELLDKARSVGFTLAQGYHLERPSPDLAELIRRHERTDAVSG